MTPKYYSAAWTDSGLLLGCSHEHKIVTAAMSCIPCAGGYVVAVENGVMRSLAPHEEREFQCGRASHCSENPAVQTTAATPQERTAGTSPMVTDAPKNRIPPRGEGETLREFVLRFLSAYGLPQHSEPISHTKHAVINTELIDAVLSRLCELETSELRRMYAEDKSELVMALGSRVRTILVAKSRCK
jgi:hypothetical protein